jgi:tRNA 2-thiouridine synthesizing protein E
MHPSNIPTDSEGFLIDLTDWDPDVAEYLAAQDDITLSREHWAIIIFLRKYYLEHEKTPGLRILVKHLGIILNDEDKSNSLYLYQLFPKGPAKQASRIAGLPKPIRCL